MTGYKAHIDRRGFMQTITGAALAAGLPVIASATTKKLPNFIIIFTDDQGYQDVGCFGSPDIKTPNLDKMAQEGCRFTDFYSASSICTPSRAALMTGCYPPRNSMGAFPGVVLGTNSKNGIHENETTIAELLKPRGYATACIGKWHLGHHPQYLPTSNGFDYYYGIPYSNDMGGKEGAPLMRGTTIIERPANQQKLTERYTREAIQFIKLNQDKPFFIYLPHSMPHTPLHVSKGFSEKSKRGLYGDVIECIDWSVGQILKTLKQLGLDENTLVVFTADNGPWLVRGAHGGSALPLRAGKGTTYEGGMREPCIMRWPGNIPAGTTCSELSGTIDMLPTLARLAGTHEPQDRTIDGRDIWPLMSNPTDAKTPHKAYYYYKKNKLEAVRSGKWKLMFARRKREEYPYRYRRMLKAGKWKGGDVPESLYDLENDVSETTNVIDKHPKTAARLKKMAKAFDAELKSNVRPQGSLHEEKG
jgi:arylsulfatase A